MTEKECSVCHAVKPIGDFHRKSTGPLGRNSACKDCFNSARTERLRSESSARHEAAKQSGKYQARLAVRNAVAERKLTRPDSCEGCGEACTPQAHHDDYAKALEVRWLCEKCHGGEHRKSGALLCRRGHVMDYRGPNGRRDCRECKRHRDRRHYAKVRALASGDLRKENDNARV